MVFHLSEDRDRTDVNLSEDNLTIEAIGLMIDVILTQKLAEIAVLNVTNPPMPTNPNPSPFSLDQTMAYIKKRALQSLLKPVSIKEKRKLEEKKREADPEEVEPRKESMQEKIEKVIISEIEKLKA